MSYHNDDCSSCNKMKTFLAVDLDSLLDLCREVYGQRTKINFEVLKEIFYVLTDEFADHTMTVYSKEEPKTEFTKILDSLGFSLVVGGDPIFVDIEDASVNHLVIACGEVDYDKHISARNLRSDVPTVVHIITFETPLTKEYNNNADNKIFLTENIVYR